MHAQSPKAARRSDLVRLATSTIAILSVLAGAAACGDTGLITVPGGDNPTHEGEGYKLVITSPVPLTLETLAVAPASVKLTKNEAPVADAAVSFAVLGTSGGARLSTLRTTTDADGAASVDVIAGSDAASFRIVIESEFTNPIEYSVSVTEPDIPPASLRVQIAYPDQQIQPVRFVEIGVYPSTVGCDAVKLEPMPNPIVGVPLQNIVQLSNAAVFNNLAGGTNVTVLARGFNDVTTAAYGCATGVALTSGQETTITVDLEKRDLDLTGTYDYDATFDMTGALPDGIVGDVFGTVIQMFDDPDDPALYLVQLFEDQVGDFPAWAESAAVDLVKSLIDKYVPERLLQIMTWIGDAANVVSNLTFEGTLTIAEDQGGNLQATETWQNVVFTWRGGCDPRTAPGCQFRKIALRNTYIKEQTFTYPVTPDGLVLDIPAHDRTIPYVRFFQLFILQVVYPEIVPGATTTGQVLNDAVNCQGMATRIATSDDADDADPNAYHIAGFELTVDQMTGWCGSALTLAGTAADSKLDDLASSVPSSVTLQGAAEIKDANRDLVCEELANGAWSGSMTVDGTPDDVTGTFAATRQ